MSRSHARPPQCPHQGVCDVHERFVHDTKDESQVTLTTHGTAHARYRHTPDFESDSESDSEETTIAPDVDSGASNGVVPLNDEPISTGRDRTGPHVRFRSRVRISAGIRRRPRLSDGRSSSTSSISGSPSSSISAPLRTHYTGNDVWGTLGSRTKFAVTRPAPMTPYLCDDCGKGNPGWNEDGDARRRWEWTYQDDDANENTHLLTAAARYAYAGRYMYDSHHDNGERERERWWREQLVDEAFGKWPGRLLNRHWWWWHLEPIVCCLCESDEE